MTPQLLVSSYRAGQRSRYISRARSAKGLNRLTMAYLACLLSKRGVQIGSPSILFIVGPTPLDLLWPLQGHIILHVHGMLRCSTQALVGLNACFLTGSPIYPVLEPPETFFCLTFQTFLYIPTTSWDAKVNPGTVTTPTVASTPFCEHVQIDPLVAKVSAARSHSSVSTSTVYVPTQDSASPCPGKEGSFAAAPNTRGSINYYPKPRFCLTEGPAALYGRLSDESWFQAEHQASSPAWPLPLMLTS
ncbi:hypothetical protein NEUTE1DRAFT_119917 [Neurospora tetrasperma FGSC 2508]|uniref:Uncharacterized protein n=1 Tax=Neurospora tetrasperma (strain FGSC 2508 / ATCC MYA-4615 / P0657) TaxID=510951 RepID=F8MEG8_NEUT8|nr:uncharacterized protein NEUTE1DRAFT_119917 [Neurospora tetrasperma FGSC 2508]EGO60799.1 hypothetical protein NEUTE1DRAFT_119917 [Neurospora tetrasperma FGSC 2508]EGZ75213.1 hypothetical protein NEUTE2DRAFT_155708 [Neurospora tetrasperma FGSC 2509]